MAKIPSDFDFARRISIISSLSQIVSVGVHVLVSRPRFAASVRFDSGVDLSRCPYFFPPQTQGKISAQRNPKVERGGRGGEGGGGMERKEERKEEGKKEEGEREK